MPFGGSQIQIIETTDQIKAKIIFEVREEVDRRFRSKYSVVSSKIGNIIANAITDAPASRSIVNGQLKVDFGLDELESSKVISEIIDIVRASTYITLNTNVKTNLIFSMTVGVNPENFVRNLSNELRYTSNGKYYIEIPWMKWLLTMGTAIIIDDYRVMYQSGKGRSDGGIMISSANSEGFRVDPSFAGTANSNFITKAIEEAFPRIILTLQEFL